MPTLPEEMVTLPEAARMACFEAGRRGAITDSHLDEIAGRLAQLLTVYCLPETRELTAEEIAGGDFTDGARAIVFGDGRPPMAGLAVASSALRAALKLLRPGSERPQ
jgi:hypothetical protein